MKHITINITNDRLRDGKFPSKELEAMDIQVSITNKKFTEEDIQLDFEVEDHENTNTTILELGRLIQSFQNKQ